MQSEERQQRFEEYLAKVEFASLDELSELADASVSTVRRDLDILESRGVVRRTHGGARLVNPKSDEFTFSARDTQQLAEKEAIGQACADLILPNQTLIVDAGTTCFHVARHLEAKSPHLITNSLPVANAFSSSARTEVMVTGGVIYPRLGVLVGPMAVSSFAQVYADVAIMSCGGITTEVVTNSHGLLIEIQRAMMQAARRVILCVDHTKFGRQSISQLCVLDAIDTVITDQLPPADIHAALEKAGVELIVTSSDGPKVILRTLPKALRPMHRKVTLGPAPAGISTEHDGFID
ncbi:MAG: DeoR/GlpR transcriptional regulator [Pedosphaera sp.]|nr:DeoR/GlpR transcriptional regulator [Pedosphaera sp.]